MTTNNDNGSISVGIRLSLDEVSQIDEIAEADGRTRSGFIRKIICDTLKRRAATEAA